MSQKAIIGATGTANYSTASSTIYGAFGATSAPAFSDSTESDFQMNFRCGSVTMQNLRVFVGVNARTTASTITVDDGGATLLTATTTASTTGTYSDLTDTVSVADTDKVTYAVATGSGSGNLQITGMTCEIVSTGQAAVQMTGIGSQGLTTARYYAFASTLSGILIGQQNSFALEALTLSNMQSVIPVNGSTGFTCTSMNNGSTGSQTNIFGSAATGLVEDTTHTDSISSGHSFEFFKPAASGSATLTACGVKAVGATANTVSVNVSANASIASGATKYVGLYGNYFNTTENQNQTPAPNAGTFSLLAINVPSNSSTSSASVVFRNGAATKNQVVSFTTATGLLQDVTNSDSVAAGALVDYQMSGTNGNVTVDWFGMQYASPAAVAATNKLMFQAIP